MATPTLTPGVLSAQALSPAPSSTNAAVDLSWFGGVGSSATEVKTAGLHETDKKAYIFDEPQPLQHEGRQRFVTSSSSSDDEDNRGEAGYKRRQYPYNSRAKPTETDPFGDAHKIPPLETISPLTSPKARTHAPPPPPAPHPYQHHHQQQQQQQQYVQATPQHQHYLYHPQQQRHPYQQQQQQQQQYHQYDPQQAPVPSPAVILIPPSLVDSYSQRGVGEPLAAVPLTTVSPAMVAPQYLYSRSNGAGLLSTSAGYPDNTLTFSRGTAASTTMPLPFDRYPMNDDGDGTGDTNDDDDEIPKEEPWYVRKHRSSALMTTSKSQSTMPVPPPPPPPPPPLSKARGTRDYNRWHQRQQRKLNCTSESCGSSSKPEPKSYHYQQGAGASERGGGGGSIDSAKMHILARPQLLLNVFTFWVNLLACHGTVDHNQRVHGILSDLREHFSRMVRRKRRSDMEKEKIDRALEKSQGVLDELRENLDDRSYDTTRSIVDVVNAVGPYVLRNYLVKKGVVSLDPNASDTAVVWANVVAASDPTLPYEGARKLTDPAELLERIAWANRVPIPGL